MTIHRKDQGLQNMIGQRVAANGVISHVSRFPGPLGTMTLFTIARPLVVSGSRTVLLDHLNVASTPQSRFSPKLVKVGQRVVIRGLVNHYQRTDGSVGTGVSEVLDVVRA